VGAALFDLEAVAVALSLLKGEAVAAALCHLEEVVVVALSHPKWEAQAVAPSQLEAGVVELAQVVEEFVQVAELAQLVESL